MPSEPVIYHVVPGTWGPYVDIRACLRAHASRNEHVKVIVPEAFEKIFPFVSQYPNAFFIHWAPQHLALNLARQPRRAKLGVVYSEAFALDRSVMLDDHRSCLNEFEAARELFDCIFAHTPRMAAWLDSDKAPAFVLPVGWDAEAMGAPRWDTPKFHRVSFHGSVVGRRTRFFEGGSLAWVINHSGLYGRSLLGALDQSAISLYLAHSDVDSFSTWRLWQVASTSCVMTIASKSEDIWPFTHDCILRSVLSHDVEPAFDLGHAALAAASGDHVDLRRRAEAAHAIAREYTQAHIEREFILPAFEKLKER